VSVGPVLLTTQPSAYLFAALGSSNPSQKILILAHWSHSSLGGDTAGGLRIAATSSVAAAISYAVDIG